MQDIIFRHRHSFYKSSPINSELAASTMKTTRSSTSEAAMTPRTSRRTHNYCRPGVATPSSALTLTPSTCRPPPPPPSARSSGVPCGG
ncbi:hypothetical protein J6590_063289 [Homalodisca vitripennis]|nr:hypothetical protein J6590_063289 [Homalodisca vitripennis]